MIICVEDMAVFSKQGNAEPCKIGQCMIHGFGSMKIFGHLLFVGHILDDVHGTARPVIKIVDNTCFGSDWSRHRRARLAPAGKGGDGFHAPRMKRAITRSPNPGSGFKIRLLEVGRRSP